MSTWPFSLKDQSLRLVTGYLYFTIYPLTLLLNRQNGFDLQRVFRRARILHDDGLSLKSKEKVGFVNLTLQSLWNQVEISIQQQVISSTVSTNYAYKA